MYNKQLTFITIEGTKRFAPHYLTGISTWTILTRIPWSPRTGCDIRWQDILDEKGSGIVETTHFASKTQLEIVLIRDELNLTGLCFLLSIRPLCLSLLLMIPLSNRSTCYAEPMEELSLYQSTTSSPLVLVRVRFVVQGCVGKNCSVLSMRLCIPLILLIPTSLCWRRKISFL